jgi:hypothetical protein
VVVGSSTEGVAEIIGALILITIAVVLFSALSILVLHPFMVVTTDSFVSTTIVGFQDTAHTHTIILEHRGGEPVKRYRITYTVTDYSVNPPVITMVNKTQADAGPGVWTVGGRCNFSANSTMTNFTINALVVDIDKNAVLLDKIVLDVDPASGPYVRMYNPDDDPNGVTERTAVLKMYYNFVNYSNYYHPSAGKVHFIYQKLGLGNITTPLVSPLPLDGFFSVSLSGLDEDTCYRVWANITWGNRSFQSPGVQFWTYANARGVWHLDEGLSGGGSIAFDAARPPADGSVHDAVFEADLAHSNGFLNVSGSHEYVQVPNNYKFDLGSEIMIREWVKTRPGGALFYGQVTGISNASLTSLSTKWTGPTMIHVYGDIYAAVYNSTIDSVITTFHIPDSGSFSMPFDVIDSQSFLIGNYCNDPDIFALGNEKYLISYGSRYYDNAPKGRIVTVNISDEGIIGELIIDGLNTSSFYGKSSRLFAINGSMYGVVFGGDYSQTFLKSTGGIITFSVDAAGNISSPLCTRKFSEDYCSRVDIAKVSQNVFALVYNSDSNGSEVLRTIHIDGSGVVTFLDCKYTTFASFMQPSIVKSGLTGLYVIAYGGDDGHPLQGLVQTVSILDDGTINGITENSPFPSSSSVHSSILALKNDYYLIAYSEGLPGGLCRAFTVKITDHIEYRDDYVFNAPLKGIGAALISLKDDSDNFLVAYGSDAVSDGVFGTLHVNFVSAPQMVIKKGDMFQIEVIDATVTVTVKTTDGYHSISGTLPIIGGWNHILVTYSAFTLSLYLNSVLQNQEICSGTLALNTEPIVFGDGFSGFLDEVGIYAQALDQAGVNNDYLTTNRY